MYYRVTAVAARLNVVTNGWEIRHRADMSTSRAFVAGKMIWSCRFAANIA